MAPVPLLVFTGQDQDLPCTLNWGYMVPNSGYLGPNRGQEEGLGNLVFRVQETRTRNRNYSPTGTM